MTKVANRPTHGDNRQHREELEERERKRKELEAKKAQLLDDRRKLLRMPEFQRVMADILAKGGMFHSVMTGNSQTFHLSGRQDFTREIYVDLAQADDDLAHQLLRPKFHMDIKG